MPIIESTYGSDEHGLIWGFRFVPGQAAEIIAAAEVPAFLERTGEDTGGEFLWLHFSLSNTASERYLRRTLSLPDDFIEYLHSEVGSTRLEQSEEMLIAVIHDVLFDSTFDAADVGTTTLCIGPRMLVSVRLRPLRSVEQLRTRVRAGQGFRSPASLLAHLLQDQANVLGDIVRKATVRVDRVEDRLLGNRIAKDRIELGALRRSLVRLQRLLAPEPTALFRLLNRPPVWIGETEQQELQEAAEEFSAAIGDSAALVERIKLIQEEVTAMGNEQTNRSLFVLTVVTVMALPINLTAGLFGMNVGGIPLSDDAHGFAVIVGLLSLLTLLLAYFAFGRRGD
jgi:zinc transporter